MANFPSISQIAGTQVGIYESLWRQADSANKGRIDGASGARLLKKSKLKESVLHKIWNLADPSANGFVDKQGFFVALKLIALAQNGKEISLGNVSLVVPPPDLSASASPSPIPSRRISASSWAITAAEKQKYDSIFASLNPVNGKLPGDAVKPVMMNSKLQFNVLSKIWGISDIDNDGEMDSDEFAVAMHLIYKALDGSPVPTVLPPNLIPPGRRSGIVIGSKSSTASSPPSFGASPARLRKSSSPPDAASSWVVTPAEKAKFDELFRQNKSPDGFLTGENARQIFVQSKLSTQLLARVWEMCDIDKRGLLTADQFALAMHIIAEKLKGVDIPATLAPNMIPPSNRSATAKEDSGAGANVAMMKELDTLSKDIEQLGREKTSLLEEVKRTEEAVKTKSQEVKASQAELDRSQSDLKDLEKRREEAKSRLDQLDEERAKFEGLIAEVKQKCKDEEDQIARLKAQLANQEVQTKSQKEDLSRSRDELKKLQAEEKDVQEQIARDKQQLDDVLKQIQASQTEMTQVRTRLADLHSAQRGITAALAQQSSSLPVQVLAPDAGDDFMSARATAGSSPVSTLSGFSMGSGPEKQPGSSEPAEDFKEDPFKSNADPFGGSSDPFKSDPFTKSDPFGVSDPFKNADPFKTSDPFKSPSSASFPVVTVAKANDPFGGVDPFGSASSFGTNSSTAASPSAANPFVAASQPPPPTTTTTTTKALSPAPSLPPKRSATVGHRPTTKEASNPFGETGGDAFGTGFADFDSFATAGKKTSTGKKEMSAEDDLVAWAKRQSVRDESARQRRQRDIEAEEKQQLEKALKESVEMTS